MITKLRSLVALAWTLLIFGLCWTPRTLLPIVEEPSNLLIFLQIDKIVHFALFAGFGFLWGMAGVRTRWVITTGILAALVSELGQATTFVNREAEWSDGTADVLGVFAGLAALALVQRFLAPPERLAPARTPSAETP